MEKDQHPMEQSHVVTVRLRDCGSRALIERIDDLRAAVRQVKDERPFRIDCAVILPDHLHMILTLPTGDADLAVRWQRIKALFSRGQTAAEGLTAGELRRGEKGIWQRRYQSRRICGTADLEACRTWIIMAPVRAGLVPRAEDWPWGSGVRSRTAADGRLTATAA